MKRGFYITVWLIAAFLKGFAQEGASNIEFVENKGQWDPNVRFKGELPTGALFLEKKGFSVVMYDTAGLAILTESHHGVHRDGAAIAAAAKLRAHAYRVSFADASEDVEILPDKPLPGYNNYFIGRDPSKWAGNCR